MKLLMLTRKIDNKDERVGFVTDWILELAKNLDLLIIICQEKGDISNIPDNIEIHSLGKEKNKSKFLQFVNCQLLIVKCLSRVDGVFSHMAAQFAVVTGLWCKLYNKKLVHWHVHRSVNKYLKLSRLFVNEYITANKESFRMKTRKKVNIFGHGINISKHKTQLTINKNANNKFIILSVGRISPSKNIDVIISAIEKIYLNEPELRDKILLQIIGGPGLRAQEKYYLELIKDVKEKGLNNIIDFVGPLPRSEVLPYYQNCDLFINLSDTGSVDKVVLEAMAFEKLVLTSNEAFKNMLPEQLFCLTNNADLLVEKIKKLYNLSKDEKIKLQKDLRQEVVDNHNLELLIAKIIKLYN